mgnify:CR=1 FL=1
MHILDIRISLSELNKRFMRLCVFFASAFILFILINNVSNDAFQYVLLWQEISDASFLESILSQRFELGSLLILWSLANAFSANTMFYLTGLLALSIKYHLFNKYLNYSSFAFVLYLLTFAHILDANQVRAALAACVIFYALFVEPKSKFTYLFLTIVAGLFHYSGVIILFLYFVHRPILPLVAIVSLGFVIDIIIYSSSYFAFALIWISMGEGEVNLANSFFIMQALIAIVCAFYWRTLSEGQKRGALISMVGVVTYISFLDNPIVAHRIRELSQIGILAILFLGTRHLTVVKFVTSICFGYILAYNVFLLSSELISVNDFWFDLMLKTRQE